MRLDLVPLLDEELNESGEGLRDAALNEERAFHATPSKSWRIV